MLMVLQPSGIRHGFPTSKSELRKEESGAAVAVEADEEMCVPWMLFGKAQESTSLSGFVDLWCWEYLCSGPRAYVGRFHRWVYGDFVRFELELTGFTVDFAIFTLECHKVCIGFHALWFSFHSGSMGFVIGFV